ncbi:MAG: MarR family winged helix-turn-helix transcriptional regulator [Cypionkella sp.]
MLTHLAHSEDVPVREIEARVGLKKSKVSRTASRLEKAGHFAKTVNNADCRLVRLSLAPKGRALMADLLPRAAAAYQAEIVARLGVLFAGCSCGVSMKKHPRHLSRRVTTLRQTFGRPNMISILMRRL